MRLPLRKGASSAAVSAALLSAVSFPLEADAVFEVRNRFSLTAGSSGDGDDIPTNEEISQKWDKMDEFLGIMFKMACKWKHGKDVHGEAAEKLKSSGGKAEEFPGIKADIQRKNLKQLEGACGMIVAKGKKTCRQGCADRWGEALKDRSECDGKCVSAYSKFERRCVSKAESLDQVYGMKLKMADSRQRCYDGYCGKYPNVWTKADAAEMTTALGTTCDAQCTPEQVKARCERKWQLEVDFHRTGVRSKCQDETTVKTCFDGKKATISTDFDTCKSDGTGTCDSQFTDCQTKGKTDSTFKEAEDFCSSRKKMCLEQVDKNCLASQKKALDEAQATCSKEGDANFDTCETDTLKTMEDEAMTTCETEKGESCPADCKKNCKVDEMSKCLEDLEGQEDPAEAFCGDFWKLLHESSEVDPITGHPIVLLTSK